jgi:phosphoribosylpyrophosphate synthetase
VAAVHPILVGNAYARLIKLRLKDLVATNTIVSPISKVSVAPVTGHVIDELLG